MSFLSSNPIYTGVGDTYSWVREWRQTLGLKNPGTVEQLSKEVTRDVFLTNYTFSGLRADLTKSLSMANPTFQISHAMSIGSQMMSPYTFSALYGTESTFLSANIDSDAQLSCRANYRWSPSLITKIQAQLAPGAGGNSMVQVEQDFQGDDCSANVKFMNPSMLDGGLTGVVMANYLQAVTPHLALGVEALYQRPAITFGPETALSYMARYKRGDWIATAQLQGAGLQGTFWRRLSERVEAGVECNINLAAGNAMMGGPSREGSTTIGAKYEFRQAIFRGQIDSNGKVSALLERRLNNALTWTMAADIDHLKSNAKLGMGITIDAQSEEQQMLYMQQQQDPNAPTPTPPPF